VIPLARNRYQPRVQNLVFDFWGADLGRIKSFCQRTYEEIVRALLRQDWVVAGNDNMRIRKYVGDSYEQRFDRRPTFSLRQFSNSIRRIRGVQQATRIQIVDAAIDDYQIDGRRIRKHLQGIIKLSVNRR